MHWPIHTCTVITFFVKKQSSCKINRFFFEDKYFTIGFCIRFVLISRPDIREKEKSFKARKPNCARNFVDV